MNTDQFDIRNMDCMTLLKESKDNEYDLAIIDCPYGINLDGGQIGYSKHEKKDWDSESPKQEYFTELFRVSTNQIIWGFNHFMEKLPSTKAIIFWNKHQNGHFAEGELAWCSMGTVKYYDRAYQKDIGNKFHPTQKPVKLYEWLLKNYAEPNQKILDTHGGSMSIALAIDRINKFDNMNLHLTCTELDKDYYDSAIKRIKEQTAQTTIF